MKHRQPEPVPIIPPIGLCPPKIGGWHKYKRLRPRFLHRIRYKCVQCARIINRDTYLEHQEQKILYRQRIDNATRWCR